MNSSLLLVVALCGNGIVTDCGHNDYSNVPAVKIETFLPHNRISNEEVFQVQTLQVVDKNSNNAFLRKTIIRDGVVIQQIIVNQRVVAEFLAINKHGYASKQNIINFNNYGNNLTGYSDFDFKVNQQFFDFHGNLVRQVVVNNYVVAQEIVPVVIVEKFRAAFVAKEFVILKQLRSNHCQFNSY